MRATPIPEAVCDASTPGISCAWLEATKCSGCIECSEMVSEEVRDIFGVARVIREMIQDVLSVGFEKISSHELNVDLRVRTTHPAENRLAKALN